MRNVGISSSLGEGEEVLSLGVSVENRTDVSSPFDEFDATVVCSMSSITSSSWPFSISSCTDCDTFWKSSQSGMRVSMIEKFEGFAEHVISEIYLFSNFHTNSPYVHRWW